jgi:hypothetical protein
LLSASQWSLSCSDLNQCRPHRNRILMLRPRSMLSASSITIALSCYDHKQYCQHNNHHCHVTTTINVVSITIAIVMLRPQSLLSCYHACLVLCQLPGPLLFMLLSLTLLKTTTRLLGQWKLYHLHQDTCFGEESWTHRTGHLVSHDPNT